MAALAAASWLANEPYECYIVGKRECMNLFCTVTFVIDLTGRRGYLGHCRLQCLMIEGGRQCLFVH